MAYEVKVTRQCQTTIPSAIRKKYKIDEGDTVIYVDLGDHIAIVPVSKQPLKDLKNLKIDAKESVSEIRKEALQTAQRLVDKKFSGD
ncbi:MAG: AbrB/MazE/SpoVT family DNA-binding domain-containing protein [Candidatus Bathyarchaeia archaeon]|jgi:AbrB family looped-hinge helix DNA binding protein